MALDTTMRDTIAAIATAPGHGGVGIVRLSGPEARDIASALFWPTNPRFTDFEPRRLHHGHIKDQAGAVLDEALAVFMPGPRSYTGQDVAELHCHGGPAILQAVLEAAMALGARPAEPGEFTFRAWKNGRMDLTQAEAVAEAIAAPTRSGLALAQARLSGALGHRVRELRAALEDLRAGVCLAVDFPEEDMECLDPADFGRGVEQVATALREMLAGFERSRCWREGALAVLAGQVNAGKSSLLNALLGRERAIVTAAPGTTRDYLEEAVSLDGLPVRLVDTAGLRESADAAEAAGVSRSRDMIRAADLVLLVVDGGLPAHADDLALCRKAGPKRVLAALNKSDLPGHASDPRRRLTQLGMECIDISAKTGAGLATLSERMRERILEATHAVEPQESDLAPNLRQSQAMRQALDELEALARDIRGKLPYDLLGVRLETACAFLSELTGDIAPADVLDSIFSRFCIGK